MNELHILRGNKKDLPVTLDENTIYVALSDSIGEYNSLFINGKEWVSKEYIDLKIGEIDKLLNEL